MPTSPQIPNSRIQSDSSIIIPHTQNFSRTNLESGSESDNPVVSNNLNSLSIISSSSAGNLSDQSKRNQLAMWAVQHNITHTALGNLLKLVKEWIPFENIPKDPRTLLGTPRSVNISNVVGGEMYHFGIRSQLIRCIESGLQHFDTPCVEHLLTHKNLITLKIGIDGLPISKSSNLQFWPILGSIDQSVSKNVFIISLFSGYQKPNNIEEFLNAFVNEMRELERDGLKYNNVIYIIRIRCIVADAPARAFIKCIKIHNAYYACERCYRRGKWSGRVIYPYRTPDILHTDETFLSQVNSKHHDGISPLTGLKLGMISQIPLDYMHLTCLGIMKKLLCIWVDGGLPHKLARREIEEISARLLNFASFIPINFARKTRSLKDFKHWKATEFRTFMLYVGPVALRGILDKPRFKHFLLFHTAMYILSSSSSNNEWIMYAQSLINEFVRDISKLYGKNMLVFNVHSLQHLPNDVKIHGPVDNFSAFEFENFMTPLKRMVRTHCNELSQVVRRVVEMQNTNSNNHIFHKGKNPKTLSYKRGDNCFITNDQRICVIVKCILVGSKYCTVRYFGSQKKSKFYPCDSSSFGISFVKNLGEEVNCDVSDLKMKCILLPFKSRYFCIPLNNFEL